MSIDRIAATAKNHVRTRRRAGLADRAGSALHVRCRGDGLSPTAEQGIAYVPYLPLGDFSPPQSSRPAARPGLDAI